MPALAIASELIAMGIHVHWMGTPSGIESRLVKAQAIPMHTIQIQNIRGKGIIRGLKAPFQMIKALIQSIKIIRAIKPAGVLSMGGYVSGPGSIAAWLCRCPLIIHEQNAVPGLTNRLLAPFASLILTGFPNLFKKQSKKTHYTGNPVRLSIRQITRSPKNSSGPIRLLIIGGSLGAHIFNQMMPQALGALDEPLRPEVWHQTGEKQLEETKLAYQQQGITAKVEPFIEDMAAAYAWADCVICRAGALTIAELSVAGLASILVPFPAAVDDHQTKNAKYLSDQGAALLVPQSQLSVLKMKELLTHFLGDSTRLSVQGARALSLSKPDATQEVVNYLLKVLKLKGPLYV